MQYGEMAENRVDLEDEKRLEALRRTGLLDSPPEEGFDRLTQLVRRLLKVPVSLVSLVDTSRQFFKSMQGLGAPWCDLGQTPLSHSFCQHVVAHKSPLVITDARKHPTLRDNLAIDELGVVAYLGIPLFTPDGYAIGSLCAIDHHPRSWTEVEIENLKDLATSVMTEIALRIRLNELKQTESDLRQSEARLLVLNHTLEQRVEARTRDLQQANRSLEQRNRELQDFAYIASHDMQEPLRKVQAFSSLLQSEYAEALDEDAGYYLDRMENAAGRMSQLIAALLSYSRVMTHGKKYREVDLNAIVRDALSDFELRIQEKQVEVVVDDLPVIEADPYQMHQLMHHLVSNALKFHRAETVPRIQIRAPDLAAGNGKPDCCVIEVADNGIGFDEKYLDRIFSPFQRLESRSAFEGTGMGLAICRRICERHRGAIEAVSAPGKGARFIVTLPVTQDLQEDAAYEK